MKPQNVFVLLVLASMMTAFGGCGGGGHDEHDSDGHAAEEAGGGHSNEHGDEHEDEHGDDVVSLTDAQLMASGVVIEPLGGGEIATHIMLPAEVGLNQDTVLHVTPRVTGIVSEVQGFLGLEVEERELLAVIESPELGEAKIHFLQMIQEQSIADAELVRQETISANTKKLLALLSQDPTPTELRTQADSLRIGINKGRLLSAYAQMKAGSANYDRERGLNDKGLSTQADLLASQEMFYTAQAEYMAAYEDIEFSYLLTLQGAQQSAMVASSRVDNAERRLHLLGLTQAGVERITTEDDADIARYELTAPRKGQIVVKHIAPGERVGPDEPVYTIADLSTVWLNIAVYSQYSDAIQQGQRVTVRVGDRTASGVVEYVSSMIEESSRTIGARVVLENPNRSWRPGEFVTVRVETEKSFADRIVPIDAIQTFEGHEVVFIQDEDGIEPVQVTTGRRNDEFVELIGEDIALGTPVVVVNSFLIKAELGKSAAGHDH